MELTARDLVVVLKLALHPDRAWAYSELGSEVSLSASQVHASVRRADVAGLLIRNADSERSVLGKAYRVNRAALLEFVRHGVQYAYPVQPGALTRGMPTAHGAEPLAGKLASSDELPVWPDPEGSVRGPAVVPLYPRAPEAARLDERLYRVLALVDAIRIGRARERKLAGELFVEELGA